MEFKLIIEDSNTKEGRSIEYQVKPGVEAVAHFYGFAVFMRPEGCVLIIPKGIQKTIKGMQPGQDRVIVMEPQHQTDREMFETLRSASLDWYPKNEVDPAE